MSLLPQNLWICICLYLHFTLAKYFSWALSAHHHVRQRNAASIFRMLNQVATVTFVNYNPFWCVLCHLQDHQWKSSDSSILLHPLSQWDLPDKNLVFSPSWTFVSHCLFLHQNQNIDIHNNKNDKLIQHDATI